MLASDSAASNAPDGCPCQCRTRVRRSQPRIPTIQALFLVWFICLLHTGFSLRGSRASRRRINNETKKEAVDRRKLAELVPNDEERNEPEQNISETKGNGGEEEEDFENITEHAFILKESYVDLRNLSLPENFGLDLGNADPSSAAHRILERITSNLEKRMVKVFENAKTHECRAKVAKHFSYFVNAIGTETSLPFANFELENSCFFGSLDDGNSSETSGETLEEMEREEEESWEYQPPRDEAVYIDDPSNLNILYGILAHSDPDAVIRLVKALYEEGHTFVVHVDGKETSEETHKRLVAFAAPRDYVHVLSDPYRVRVNWGGFSMVNATLQVLRYAFAVDLDFDKFAHLAESTYPVASNSNIRRRLAEYPIDANFMHIIKTPTNPHEDSFHYFVECDDAVHRIYRLPPLRWSNAGIDLHTSSQWFILSRDFAKYLADAKPGTLVHGFLEYAEHMVVADEQFFGTVLRHTEFCHKHHNRNWLFLDFGEWEDRKEKEERDPRKCIMPHPDHCGRSPISVIEDKVPDMALSNKHPLFARKFAKDPNSRVKDVIDNVLRDDSKAFDITFEGDGVLIVAKETLHTHTPLCLGLGQKRSKVQLVPCFRHDLRDTVDSDWEFGGVAFDDAPDTNRWKLGSCIFDGRLERMASGEIVATAGNYSETGPLCTIEIMGGEREGNCMEAVFSAGPPNGAIQVTQCNTKHNQSFSFGTGASTPRGSIVATSNNGGFAAGDSAAGENRSPHACLGFTGELGTNNDDYESSESEDGAEEEMEYTEEEYSSGEDEEALDEDGQHDETGDAEGETEGGFQAESRHLESNDHSDEGETLDEELDEDDPGVVGGPIKAMDCTENGVLGWVIVPYVIDNEEDYDSQEDDENQEDDGYQEEED